MSTTELDLEQLESNAADRLDAERGHVEADLDAAAGDTAEPEPEQSLLRVTVAVAMPTVGAAVMVGGVFIGATPRVVAGVAGIAGVGLAAVAARIRRPAAANVVIAAGLFVVGLVAIGATGLGHLGAVQSLVSDAVRNGDVTRPPVQFLPGWHAVIAWMLAIVGFCAAWTALVVRKPSVGLLIPLPVAALGGISVPKAAQVPSGIAVLVLFAVGLGIVSSARAIRTDEERPPLAYELRKAGRGVGLIAVITVVLVGLAQTNVLFPKPVIDPTKQPQRPRTAPLNPADDRVLFTASPPNGPYRTGSLDVYDGTYFRLPPFADSKLKAVPSSGIVNPDLTPGPTATITIGGLGGAVLPTLPNTVGIVAKGDLSYDARNANIRLTQGAVAKGFSYTVAAASLPKVTELQQLSDPLPSDVTQFTQVPPPPPAVVDLVNQAKAKFTDKWDQYLFLFNAVRDTVTAAGEGTATAIPPSRVQDLLAGSKQGSPFEIVAVETLLARWDGIPARIAFGYDIVHSDHVVDGKFQAHPNDGATFVEVYFPRFEWLPLNAPPKKARASVGNDPNTQKQDQRILPSDNIAVNLFLPVITQPASVLAQQVIGAILVILGVLLLVGIGYLLYPAAAKARRRSRSRGSARAGGPRARVAWAYAEWRDYAADLGYAYVQDTPLGFLDRFSPDPEHAELAWLVTRTMWGDLQHDIGEDEAGAAEELSRALRRRLAAAHPPTLRVVAALSRVSVRQPYVADAPAPSRPSRKEAVGVPATA